MVLINRWQTDGSYWQESGKSSSRAQSYAEITATPAFVACFLAWHAYKRASLGAFHTTPLCSLNRQPWEFTPVQVKIKYHLSALHTSPFDFLLEFGIQFLLIPTLLGSVTFACLLKERRTEGGRQGGLVWLLCNWKKPQQTQRSTTRKQKPTVKLGLIDEVIT